MVKLSLSFTEKYVHGAALLKFSPFPQKKEFVKFIFLPLVLDGVDGRLRSLKIQKAEIKIIH